MIPIEQTELARFRQDVLPIVRGNADLAAGAELLATSIETHGAIDELAYVEWCRRFIASVVDRIEDRQVAMAVLGLSRLAVIDREMFDEPRVFSRLMLVADRGDATEANRVLVDDLVYNRVRSELAQSPSRWFDALDDARAVLGESLFTSLFHDGVRHQTADALSALLERYREPALQRPILRSLLRELVARGNTMDALTRLRHSRDIVRAEPINKRRELRNRLIAAGLPKEAEPEIDELLAL